MIHRESTPETLPIVRVMLVDDDEDDYRLTQVLLDEISNVEFQLDWEHDFDAALESICKCEHDIYLIDYRLGERSGLDLMQALKERNCHQPVILLTGQGELEIDRAAELAGAADYLEKCRLDPVVLERMIRYAMRQHSQEKELARKVAERTAALEAANKELQEADERKDIFLATLAHELRNPLAPIRNALAIQKLVVDDPVATQQARGVIERQVVQLVRLIDDLLDASRLTRGKFRLELETINLAEPLDAAIESSRPGMDHARHEFVKEYPAEEMLIQGDRVRLAQLFTNLLNNAVKYTPPGGTIMLNAVKEGAHYVVTVTDTGSGIPMDFLPCVFDLFTQIDRTLNRSEGGLGIGLALVRRIVELHGGEVRGDSPGTNLGSTFTVRLPVLQKEESPQQGCGEC